MGKQVKENIGKTTHPFAVDKDLRLRKALLHMLSEKTSWTLPLDTYPVMI